MRIRAKFWGQREVVEATAHLDGQKVPMNHVSERQVWETQVPPPHDGIHSLKVTFKAAHWKIATDEIRLAVGQRTEGMSEERDQDNALEAWPEHGLLGTQLGPNKNGKKW
jgi:Icc protein